MNLLALFEISDQNLNRLAQIPNLTVIKPDDLTPTLMTKIDFIYGWGTVGPRVLEQSKQLKFIQAYSAGVDYFPLDQLAQKRVLLANVSGIHGEPIAETVLAYVLDFTRGIHAAERAQTQSKWVGDELRPTISTLADQKAVIFGTGHIGQQIAKRLQQFSVKTVGVNRHGHPVDYFDQVTKDDHTLDVVRQADFIINIMPLTTATWHFFDDRFFSALAGHQIFINVGRGPSVDTSALIHALDNHQLAGAALDVFEQEPLPADSPLWSMANVLITPHISGGFKEYGDEAFDILMLNLQTYLKSGKLAKNEVNLKAGY
jgi:phosphoglycerate dehydrogenase-like enzyme